MKIFIINRTLDIYTFNGKTIFKTETVEIIYLLLLRLLVLLFILFFISICLQRYM